MTVTKGLQDKPLDLLSGPWDLTVLGGSSEDDNSQVLEEVVVEKLPIKPINLVSVKHERESCPSMAVLADQEGAAGPGHSHGNFAGVHTDKTTP